MLLPDRCFTCFGGWAQFGSLLLVFLGPLALYASTMPTSVVVEDDGLFLMNGVFLGVQHPPGYPVFTVVHHLFQQLPLWTPAVKGHLLSGIFAALACGLVYAISRRLGAGALASLLGAWMLAVGGRFWSQAVITEVYTLHVFLFLGVALSLLELWRDPAKRWPWLVAPACFGLGLANNWGLMALAALAALVALWPLRSRLLGKLPLCVGVFVLSVGVPYAWLWSHSRGGPEFSFFAPFENWSDFLGYVSRRYYADVDVHSSWNWQDLLGYLGWFGQDVFHQTAFVGGVVAVLGLVWLFRRGVASGSESLGREARWFAAFSLLAFLCNSVLLLLLLRNEYDDVGLQVFHAYPLVAYAMVSLWFAVGLGAAAGFCGDRLTKVRLPKFAGMDAGRAAVMTVGSLLVVASLGMNWSEGSRRGDDFAVRYSDFVFDSVEEGATLLVSGDLSSFVLGYRHFVEGVRPDLRLVNFNGLTYPTNFVRYSDQHADGLPAAILNHYVRIREWPVYWAYGLSFPDLGDVSIGWRGPVALVMPVEDAAETAAYEVTGAAVEYGEWLLDSRPGDGSEIVYRNVLLYTYCSYASTAVHYGDAEDAKRLEGFIERAWDSPYCLLGMAHPVLEELGTALYDRSVASGTTGGVAVEGVVGPEVVGSWLARSAELRETGRFQRSSVMEAEFLNSMGKLRILQGRPEEAQEYFLRSADVYGNDLNFGLMVSSW